MLIKIFDQNFKKFYLILEIENLCSHTGLITIFLLTFFYLKIWIKHLEHICDKSKQKTDVVIFNNHSYK